MRWRWRSPVAKPTTKQLLSRLVQDTAVAAPLKGRSATKSFLPVAMDQTITVESSANHPHEQQSVRRGNTRRTDTYETIVVGADGKIVYRTLVPLESPLECEFYSVRHYYGVRLTCLIMRDRLGFKCHLVCSPVPCINDTS